mgnify:CR=1 FL=1
MKNEFEKMLEEVFGIKSEEKQIPLEAKGYKSVIPTELVKETIELHNKLNDLRRKVSDVAHTAIEKLDQKDPDFSYASLQLALFMDTIEESDEHLSTGAVIGTLDRDVIDELAKEGGISTDNYVSKVITNLAVAKMERLKDRMKNS